MAFEEGDRVVLRDEHSDHDGESGEVTQVMENMFGSATYTVSFEEGQEQGVAEDLLEAADDADEETEE
jgi:hypothetical protein